MTWRPSRRQDKTCNLVEILALISSSTSHKIVSNTYCGPAGAPVTRATLAGNLGSSGWGIVSMDIPERGLFIGGSWRQPVKGGRYPVICPATEQQVGTIPAATAEDVEAAVAAAQQAVSAKRWTVSSGSYRAQVLRDIASKVSG